MDSEGVGFVLGIGADGSGAKQEIGDVEDKFNDSAKQMSSMQEMSAEEMGDAWEALSAKKKRAIQEVAEEDERATQQQLRNDKKKKASASDFSQAVRTNLQDLMVLRRAMYSTVGLASLGFMAGEWENVSKAIADAALSLGGFDEGLRQVEKDAEAASLASLNNVSDFTEAQMTALLSLKDIHAFREKETQFEKQNTEDSRDRIARRINQLQGVQSAYDSLAGLQSEMMAATQIQDMDEANRIRAKIEAINEEVKSYGGMKKVQEELGKERDLSNDRAKQLNRLRLEGHAQELSAIVRADHAAGAAERKREAAAKRLSEFERKVDAERATAERRWDAEVKKSATEQEKAFKAVEKRMRQMPALPASFFSPLIDGAQKLTTAQRLAIPTENEVAKVHAELLKLNLDLTKSESLLTAQRLAANPAIQQLVGELGRLKGAHHDLDAAIRQELGLGPEYLGFLDSFAQAAKQSVEAVKENMKGAVESLSAQTAGLIGGRRAQAGVEMAWEIAEGIKCLAEGTWPPNPAAIVAAGLHFEAAAQYGIIAGKGSGRHGGAGRGGAGAGSGSDRDSSSRSGRQGVERNAGAADGGGKSGSGQTILQISGGKLSSNGQQQLAAWVGMGSAVGLFKFNSSGSSGIAASRY